MGRNTTTRAQRAARQADISGSGPTRRGESDAPGALSPFQMFGEAMLSGILVTVASLPIVTLPVALAAGGHHLRAFIRGDASHWATFWREIRAGLAGSACLGLGLLALSLVFVANTALARTGALPGGVAIAWITGAATVALATAIVIAGTAWDPETGWLAALRAVPALAGADPLGALLFVVSIVLVVFLAMVLVPLIVPLLGCLALAMVAIPMRRGAAG
jgi:hypothetical protein